MELTGNSAIIERETALEILSLLLLTLLLLLLLLLLLSSLNALNGEERYVVGNSFFWLALYMNIHK